MNSPEAFPSKEEIARGYDGLPAHLFMPRKFHRRCIGILGPRLPKDGCVVDLGCGHGTLLGELAKLRPDLKLSGCDLSPVLAENTRKRVAGADIRVADIEGLPYAAGSFDGAFATEVMEHLPEPTRALRGIRDILKPGGWLLISLPNRDWFRFEEYLRQRTRFQPVDDRFYRVAEVEGFLRQAGYRVDRVRGGENLYFGGGLPRLLEKLVLPFCPRLHRRMKRMIILAQKPLVDG